MNIFKDIKQKIFLLGIALNALSPMVASWYVQGMGGLNNDFLAHPAGGGWRTGLPLDPVGFYQLTLTTPSLASPISAQRALEFWLIMAERRQPQAYHSRIVYIDAGGSDEVRDARIFFQMDIGGSIPLKQRDQITAADIDAVFQLQPFALVHEYSVVLQDTIRGSALFSLAGIFYGTNNVLFNQGPFQNWWGAHFNLQGIKYQNTFVELIARLDYRLPWSMEIVAGGFDLPWGFSLRGSHSKFFAENTRKVQIQCQLHWSWHPCCTVAATLQKTAGKWKFKLGLFGIGSHAHNALHRPLQRRLDNVKKVVFHTPEILKRIPKENVLDLLWGRSNDGERGDQRRSPQHYQQHEAFYKESLYRRYTKGKKLKASVNRLIHQGKLDDRIVQGWREQITTSPIHAIPTIPELFQQLESILSQHYGQNWKDIAFESPQS